MAHKLLLNIQDGVYDNRFIHVADLSLYDDVLGITLNQLQVLPPFTDEWLMLSMSVKSDNVFNSIDFGLSTKELYDLPDGPYTFHYSVAPNKKVFILNYHYRVANLLNQVLGKMTESSVNCDSIIDACGNVTIEKNQNVLLHIWMLLQGVQSLGRNELTFSKAKDLYLQAQREFTRLYDVPCKNC